MAAKRVVRLTPEDRAVLQMMALAAHDRCRTAMGVPERAAHPLSAREIECLQWAATGKTDVEIGKLLGIATATAHFHIERAKRKLAVRTRAEAIARLVLSGDI